MTQLCQTESVPPVVPSVVPLLPRAAALAAECQTGRGWGVWNNLWWHAMPYKAQALREHADEPDPALRAGKVQARVFELAAVEIAPLQIFAACGIMPVWTPELLKEAAETVNKNPMQGHSHHTSIDYAKLIRLGVRGLLEEIDDSQAKHRQAGDAAAVTFLDAMKIALQGLVAYGRRYREEAARHLQTETDPARRAELQRIVDALARVPYEPATTMFEAMQSMLLLHFGVRLMEPDSAVGRLDLMLDAHYRRDLAEGRLTQTQAAEMIQLFMAHLQELSIWSDAVVVGGSLSDGSPFWNDLTYFVLDAVAQLNTVGPGIGFRWSDGMPRELLRRAARCVQAGTSHPGFWNDTVTIPAMVRGGFKPEHAVDYVNCNCIELASAGRTAIFSGYNYTNLVKPIEFMLNGGRPVVPEYDNWPGAVPPPPADMPMMWETFDQFRDAYGRYVRHTVAALVAETNALMSSWVTHAPLPLSSAFIDGCIERGLHCMRGGALYGQTFPSFVGLANAVDSLAAVRQAVFEDGRFTLAELGEFCREDFAGREAERLYLLHRCPKFGNGDARVDDLMRWLVELLAAELAAYRNPDGKVYGAQYFGFKAQAARGTVTGATPDGRRRGASVSGSFGGDHGTDVQGPTALIRSATCFDHTLAPGGLCVNAAFHPSALRTEADLEKFVDLVLAYFDLGGMQVQFNCIRRETLEAAQRLPEQHRNLLVRVAGYTDRFVLLEKNLQEEIISRTLVETLSSC